MMFFISFSALESVVEEPNPTKKRKVTPANVQNALPLQMVNSNVIRVPVGAVPPGGQLIQIRTNDAQALTR